MATGFRLVKDDYSPLGLGDDWVFDKWNKLTRYAMWKPLGHVPSPEGWRVLIVDYSTVVSSSEFLDITLFDKVLHTLHPAGSAGIVDARGFVTETVTRYEISDGSTADEFTFDEMCALAVRRDDYPDALTAHGLGSPDDWGGTYP